MKMSKRIFNPIRSRGLLLFALCTTLLVSACSGITTTPVEVPEEPVSVLTGKRGGIKLFSDTGKTKAGVGLPVNALLWRAALDIASFMPLDDVDTFGGSIITEWHQPIANPDRRLKLNMFVTDRELRADAITVRTYVQNRVGTEWVDAGRDEALGRKLEDLILTRARELRAAATAETVN